MANGKGGGRRVGTLIGICACTIAVIQPMAIASEGDSGELSGLAATDPGSAVKAPEIEMAAPPVDASDALPAAETAVSSAHRSDVTIDTLGTTEDVEDTGTSRAKTADTAQDEVTRLASKTVAEADASATLTSGPIRSTTSSEDRTDSGSLNEDGTSSASTGEKQPQREERASDDAGSAPDQAGPRMLDDARAPVQEEDATGATNSTPIVGPATPILETTTSGMSGHRIDVILARDDSKSVWELIVSPGQAVFADQVLSSRVDSQDNSRDPNGSGGSLAITGVQLSLVLTLAAGLTAAGVALTGSRRRPPAVTRGVAPAF